MKVNDPYNMTKKERRTYVVTWGVRTTKIKQDGQMKEITRKFPLRIRKKKRRGLRRKRVE